MDQNERSRNGWRNDDVQIAATPTYLDRVKADWKNKLATLPVKWFNPWLFDCVKSF